MNCRPTFALSMLALGALSALAGCGGSSPPPPSDPAFVQTERLARLAYGQGRSDQAATLYRQALDQAFRRDDLQGIGDGGYNLAIVELNRGHPATALDVSRSTRGELVRRGAEVPADLELVEAVALYRTGVASAAADQAARIVLLPSASAETVARATFLTGLVADDDGDTAALAAALAALSQTPNEASGADRDELSGRVALRQGDPIAAGKEFIKAADRRRALGDDRGMARALALAGGAAEARGDAMAAADLFLRAGRSAALSDDPGDAVGWLQRARDLALRDNVPAVATEAQSWLDQRGKPADR
ncbi:MAG: hypothetical protein IPK66_07370 [Rhodospirillales bacterium]|nr:hypothetical protein [Rhodospirillales bacterium]